MSQSERTGKGFLGEDLGDRSDLSDRGDLCGGAVGRVAEQLVPGAWFAAPGTNSDLVVFRYIST